jgi:hypothetical protein
MDEIFRMLAQEHQAELQREADKWRRAAEVRRLRAADRTPHGGPSSIHARIGPIHRIASSVAGLARALNSRSAHSRQNTISSPTPSE